MPHPCMEPCKSREEYIWDGVWHGWVFWLLTRGGGGAAIVSSILCTTGRILNGGELDFFHSLFQIVANYVLSTRDRLILFPYPSISLSRIPVGFVQMPYCEQNSSVYCVVWLLRHKAPCPNSSPNWQGLFVYPTCQQTVTAYIDRDSPCLLWGLSLLVYLLSPK